jgi:uncharacterized membrane protein YczE
MGARRSITALVLYFVGAASLIVSAFMLMAPTPDSYGPALVGLLLGVLLMGVGRACQHLSRIRDLMEGRA